MIYYFTFGQKHIHPTTGMPMKDYWIEIDAPDYDSAREIMVKHYGVKWGFQYTPDDWRPGYFPGGCYESYSTSELKTEAMGLEVIE